MTRPNITPGPWKLDARLNEVSTLSGAGKHLATFHRDGKTTAQIYPSERESEANARAIAALPALLEALEDALPGLESDLLYGARYPQLNFLKDHEACLAHKRARIAKARAALIAAGYQF